MSSMEAYTNNPLYVFYNRSFFLRTRNFKSRLKGVVKMILVMISKSKVRSKYKYFVILNKRRAGNRYYTIFEKEGVSYFAKSNSLEESLNFECLKRVVYLGPQFEHRNLTYTEWKSLSQTNGLYHGDVNQTNVLASKKKVILTDWEYKGSYSKGYQLLDFIINMPSLNKRLRQKSITYQEILVIVQIIGLNEKEFKHVALERQQSVGCELLLYL